MWAAPILGTYEHGINYAFSIKLLAQVEIYAYDTPLSDNIFYLAEEYEAIVSKLVTGVTPPSVEEIPFLSMAYTIARFPMFDRLVYY